MVTKIKAFDDQSEDLLRFEITAHKVKTYPTMSKNVVAIDNKDLGRVREMIKKIKSPKATRYEISQLK